MASQVITLRMPQTTAERLKRLARKARRSVNEVGCRSIEEWLRQDEFSGIEFRSFGGERHACIKGELQVWQLIEVAKAHGMDLKKTADYFQWSEWKVQAGFDYYAAYPEEINTPMEENESITFEELRKSIPHIERFTVKARPKARA